MSKRHIRKEPKTANTLHIKAEIIADSKAVNSMSNWLTVLVFVLPLLFSRVTLDPAIVPRYIFLCSFVLLFFIYFLWRKKIKFSITGSIKIVFALGIAFGIWSLLSLVSSINPSAGYYEIARHFLNLILLLLVYITVQKEGSQILKVCKAILLMSLIQSFVGIIQYYDLAFADLPGANAKPFGLMANRNLFGSAQALVLPFIIFVLYKAKTRWKYLAVIALTGAAVSIILSQTRSAWLASLAILISSTVLILLFSKPNRKAWLIGSLVSIASIIGLVALLLIADKDKSLTQSVKERANSFTQTGGTSATAENVNERLRFWNKTIKLIKDKPLFGAGVGNWKLAIPSYGTEGLVWAYGYYTPDRPHNVYLHITSEVGIPGFILYLAMWVAIIIIGFKIIARRSQSEDTHVLAILMISGLASFAVDCMFSFANERLEHFLYTILMGGIILGLYADQGIKTSLTKRRYILPAAIFLVAPFNLFMGIKKYDFEKHMRQSIVYDTEHSYQDVIDEVESGKTAFVSIDLIGKSLELYSMLAYKELKDYDNALKEAGTARKYNPNSSMVYNNVGAIYTGMKKYDSAIINYLHAIELAPHYDMSYKNLAVNYFQLGNYAACLDALSKVWGNIQDDSYLTNLFNEAKKRLFK